MWQVDDQLRGGPCGLVDRAAEAVGGEVVGIVGEGLEIVAAEDEGAGVVGGIEREGGDGLREAQRGRLPLVPVHCAAKHNRRSSDHTSRTAQ